MDPDPARPAKVPTAPDDEQLGALVRATAEDWRLPPQRLDQPTWRDRVGGRSKPRPRGWFARIAAPATAAVVGSVIVAFVAVWLTTPRGDQSAVGKSPGASTVAPSAGASSPSAASTLPALLVNGALPDPTRVLVGSDAAYQIADLATGTFGIRSVGSHSGPTTMLPRPGGGWVCVCADWTGLSGGGSPTGAEVTLETIDARGAGLSSTSIRTIRGEADPAVSMTGLYEQADVHANGSADGRQAFVGWSARQGSAGWTAGIDVVDVAAGSVVSSVPLTFAEPAAAAGRIMTRTAPRVELSHSGDTILVSSFWFVEDPSPTPPSGTDHWTASFDGREIGALKAAGSTPGERCGEFDSGLIDATSYYVLCWTPDGRLMAERNRVDGSSLSRTEVPRMDGSLDGGSLVRRHGDLLYLWDPFTARLTRYDLRSGAVDSGTGTAAAPPTGPLDAFGAFGRQLGRWLAPPALAKVYLDPALVVSADGTRVYALGIDARSGADNDGSNGVYAFDASTLKPVGHWTPTADFISLAISADGRFVYAAGDAGRDAAGNEARVPASITVYDTSDGSVRLIAGSLGSATISFPGPVVQ